MALSSVDDLVKKVEKFAQAGDMDGFSNLVQNNKVYLLNNKFKEAVGFFSEMALRNALFKLQDEEAPSDANNK